MKYVSALFIIFFTTAALVLTFQHVQSLQAQVFNSSSGSIPSQIPDVKEEVDIDVTPLNPRPNDDVTVSLQAPGTDLNKAIISWKVNGKVQRTGAGIKTFTFNAGPLGTVSNIVVDILPYNGPAIEKSLQVSAQSVDIMWEADTYRPPFYQGKSLYTPEAKVTFMAAPNLTDAKGSIINPDDLVYTWSIDNTVHADMSGYGKNSYQFDGDILAQETYVSVHVANVAGDVQGDGSLLISPSGASVFAYENNPTYGVLFNRAIADNFNLTKNEITLAAYPYSFSADSRNDANLQYTWSINSSPIASPQTQNNMVFRNSNDSTGSSVVTLAVQDSDKIRQGAAYNFDILLNQKSQEPFNF